MATVPTHARCHNCQHFNPPARVPRPRSVTPLVHGVCGAVETRPQRTHLNSVCASWAPELYTCPECGQGEMLARDFIGHMAAHATPARTPRSLRAQRAQARLARGPVTRTLGTALETLGAVCSLSLRVWA